MAATIQAVIGNVAAGSLFAVCQSIAAAGRVSVASAAVTGVVAYILYIYYLNR